MALGVPIVSTPVDGLKDLIKNGENGYLSDDDEVLADKICEIVNSQQTHDSMGKLSKEISAETQNKQIYKEKIMSEYR